VAPSASTTYQVTDGKSCLTDVFNVTVTSSARTNISFIDSSFMLANIKEPKIEPTLVQKGQQVTIRSVTNQFTEGLLIDENGRAMRQFRFTGTKPFSTDNLTAGTYFLKLRVNNKQFTRKFVVIH
jgi:hypothetical protein